MAHRDRTTLDYVQPGAEERGRLRETFDFNDLNRDGQLTFGEFLRFMRGVDENMTAEEIQIGFDEIDTNRDGTIGFDEFFAWWARS
jgi:Ca2+-binding EF-hand superfamily protein